MKNKKETFYFDADLKIEASEEQPNRLIGYAMKYNILSSDRGGYRDVFRQGVFGDISNKDVKAYRDHEPDQYLGRTANGTLQLWLDNTGLKFSVDLPDTTIGRDTKVLVERNDLAGMSFGVVVNEYQWKDEEVGPIREIYGADLHEISVVFNPAFPKTELALASLQKWKEEQQTEIEIPTPKRNRAKRILKISDLTA